MHRDEKSIGKVFHFFYHHKAFKSPSETIWTFTEEQCLKQCWYLQKCDAVNIQQLTIGYFCELFIGCSFTDYTDLVHNNNSFFARTNNIFYGLKRTDCLSWKASGFNKSGIYEVSLTGSNSFKVWCDMEDAGGGWNVIMRRETSTPTFNKSWDEYKNGFGDLNSTHWLGNDHIHQLTKDCNEAKVTIVTTENEVYSAKFAVFTVANETDKYRLSAESAFDANETLYLLFNGADGMGFSTYDVDNDQYEGSCSQTLDNAGWWFSTCNEDYLTGDYTTELAVGNVWMGKILKYSIIKTRRSMNLAPYKPSVQSSVFWDLFAQYGNDGIISNDVQHTNFDENPWWQVDLMSIANIFWIRIYQRSTFLERFTNAEIISRVSFGGHSTVCHNIPGDGSKVYLFSCYKETFARYVRITLKKSATLHMAELEIYGYFIK